MWFIVSKKRYQRDRDLQHKNERWWANRANDLQDLVARLDDVIAKQDQRLASTERTKVLADLDEALSLVQEYQRALNTVSAADPNIGRANDLLRRWNKEPEGKTYLGASIGQPPPQLKTFILQKWKKEEEEWGVDGAYGQHNVRIKAEAIDEGDNKEPDFTRAQIHFVDLSTKPNIDLESARAVTEEAKSFDPDTDLDTLTLI